MLADAGLAEGDAITYAALLLLGKPASISRHLAQAEVIFEYRSAESAGPAADREEYREPFLLFHDRLWTKINLRNDRQSYQQDFFRYDLPTFNEASVREAVLNAICHREQAVRQTKSLPDFSRSAAHEVFLTLSGTVQNPAFLRFIEQMGDEAFSRFQTLDFLALDRLSRGDSLPDAIAARLPFLVEIGAVESQGRGKEKCYFLSRALYQEMGSPGSYTRKRGLDHETNKALLLKHLTDRGEAGSPISELKDVLPAQSRTHIRRMLSELRDEGAVELVGEKRSARWRSFSL